MKFVRNLVEKIQEIEPMDVVFACMVAVLVVMAVVIAVGGALVILCLVRGIVTVVTGAF
jgi:hypothetical protein